MVAVQTAIEYEYDESNAMHELTFHPQQFLKIPLLQIIASAIYAR
ncbi:MAG: hypothetical protein ACKO9Q_17575 [Pirellula sp.]